MSVEPTDMIAGVVGMSAAAGNAVRREALQKAVGHMRQADSERRAATAAGVGQAEQDEQIADREVDGRLMWQHPAAPDSAVDSDPPNSADPEQQTGRHLDVSG